MDASDRRDGRDSRRSSARCFSGIWQLSRSVSIAARLIRSQPFERLRWGLFSMTATRRPCASGSSAFAAGSRRRLARLRPVACDPCPCACDRSTAAYHAACHCMPRPGRCSCTSVPLPQGMPECGVTLGWSSARLRTQAPTLGKILRGRVRPGPPSGSLDCTEGALLRGESSGDSRLT